MNNIKDYVENLDKKNFIMLIVSILILCFIIVYYLNDFFSKKEKLLFKEKIELIKKIRETRILNSKITNIKKRHKLLKTKYNNLNNDLVYLLSEIESSNVLIIKKVKFLHILHSYINIGANINASFDINQTKKLNKYNINIKGDFISDKFLNFAYFIRTIEQPKAIITINNLQILKNRNNIIYDMNVSIWSFK